MRDVLLDTDVFSFALKRDTRAANYATDIAGARVCLSFQTVAELRLWALLRRWGQARTTSLEASLAKCIVLPYDDALAGRWAQITADRHRLGRPIQCGDAWIAATAMRHNLVLLTHNAADYADIAGLRIVSHAAPPA
jgi:tRNA(fMet)-specific endonuclease VapC